MSSLTRVLFSSWTIGMRTFHSVNQVSRMVVPQLLSPPPALQSIQPSRSFRDKDVLKLRCKDCYFKKVDDRWWVLCPTHGRHKQREKLEDTTKKWITTHLTIGGGKPFMKKEEAYICNLAPPGPYDYRRNFLKCYSDKPPKRYMKGLSKGFLVPFELPFKLPDREIIPPRKRKKPKLYIS